MNQHLTDAGMAAALSPVAGLIGLWLRLSWRTRQEQARHRTLVDLAQALRQGCQLEEHAADGTWLRITVSDATGRQNDGDDPDWPVMEPPGTTSTRKRGRQ